MIRNTSQTRRIKVMQLVWGLGMGGMENTLINVCNRLPRDLFEPSICFYQNNGAMERRVETEHVELVHVRRWFGNDPSYPLRLARELRRRRIDILHTNMWATLVEGIVAAKLARVPVVIHEEHGMISDRRRRVVAQRWAWRKASRVVSVSAALADRMTSVVGYPRNDIHVINNSVDTERFRPLDTPKHELRRELILPTDAPLIGMVSRFVPFKDHAGVIRAIARLHGTGCKAHLALVGDGPLRDELKQLADELDVLEYVHFLGELNNVERLLNALDIFVSNSSHNEGLSLAILEAMACEVPVVATRVAAHSEVLDEGKAGKLVTPGDERELVEQLRQLVANPPMRSTLARAGRERAIDRFGVLAMVESYSRMYVELSHHLFCRD